MFHADMYMGKGFDTAILKYLKPLSVVSGTRIEPPLHPKGLEKIVEDFGMYPEDFLKEEFDKFVQKTIQENEGKTTRGIFAPWAIYKEDITSIGMHDEFFHSYHEDSDIFNRFILNGYDIIQTWEGWVYHLTCRGGQFQDGIEQVTQDPKFHLMKHNAAKNYVRKWGHFVKNDQYQYPIIPSKYDIQFDIQNCNLQLLSMLEPWCSKMSVDLSSDMIENYIRAEKGNTTVNLEEKINQSGEGDIVVSFDASKVNQQSFQYIQQLSEIFDANEIQEGSFEFDIFDVKINKVKTYQEKLIRL
jgi:hypothetical protein